MIVPAPAKLNLFLHVVGRRADGYHLLQTLFQLLDVADGGGDLLHFGPAAELELNDLPGVPRESNLVWRAARALQDHTGCRSGARIRLDKRLPAGGGLGGGSSDAATTLLALNHLWRLGLDLDTLAAIGLGLGADVPVFVRGHTAFAEGVGERLTPVDLPARWFVVVNPGCHVETARVFRDPSLTRDTPVMTMATLREPGYETRLRNDCEAVVRRLHPEVADALDWLGQFGSSRLTGTGACVFLATGNEDEARRILQQLPPRFSGFVARGVNRSPAHDAIGALAATGD
ncbi:MAG: 4-(cytidine 5'-diphospho)-2-C-methyl-D-erythritol kinase [Gammaproteobacteria bacterium]